MRILSSAALELRHSVRGLARAPAFAVVTTLTLAVGIGATLAMTALLDAVVVHPLEYSDAGRLVTVAHRVPGIGADATWGLSAAEYFSYRRATHTIEQLGIYSIGDVTIVTGTRAHRVPIMVGSASVFDVLGLHTQLGRAFTSAETRPGFDESAVVISNALWREAFDGRRDIIGQKVKVSGTYIPIVGVLRPGADLPDGHVDIWLPFPLDSTTPPTRAHQFKAVARLRAGSTLQDATSELAGRASQLSGLAPAVYSGDFLRSTGFRVATEPLASAVTGSAARLVWLLLAGVFLVLLVACANVASLFVVRYDTRRRELNTRRALGATRADLLTSGITETGLLATAAALLAVPLAFLTLRILRVIAPADIHGLGRAKIGLSSLAIAMGLAITVAAVFGALLTSLAMRGTSTLGASSRGLSSSASGWNARGVLLTGQVALAVLLSCSAGLMLRTVSSLRAVSTGFDPSRVIAFDISLPGDRYPTYEAVGDFYERMTSELRRLPGVESVGGVEHLPLAIRGKCVQTYLEDRPADSLNERLCLPADVTLPGYFQTLRIPVIGRDQTWSATDREQGPIVVSRAAAARLWPASNAIGKGVRAVTPGAAFYRVVGIAGDVKADGLDRPATPIVYFPPVRIQRAGLWGPARNLSIVVRAASDHASSLLPAVRRALVSIDPEVPIAHEQLLADVVSRSMMRSLFAADLLSAGATLAIVLSLVGMYSTLSYVVFLRAPELAIRVALGAPASTIAASVVGRALQYVGVGLLAGLIAALQATSFLSSELYGVRSVELPILICSGGLVALLAAAASAVPGMRAARTNPVNALRDMGR